MPARQDTVRKYGGLQQARKFSARSVAGPIAKSSFTRHTGRSFASGQAVRRRPLTL